MHLFDLLGYTQTPGSTDYDHRMPTGPKHLKHFTLNGSSYAEDCRCMVGEDHEEGADGPLGEALSPWAAEEIWLSSGMDEDYDFR